MTATRGPPTLERMTRRELAEARLRRRGWYKATREWIPHWLAVMATSMLVCLFLFIATGVEFYLVLGIFVLLGVPYGLLDTAAKRSMEWRGAHMYTKLSFDRVVIRVRNVLRDAGVPFEMRGMERHWGNYYEEFRLRSGLVITVRGRYDTAVYIGKVTWRNRREVRMMERVLYLVLA